MKPEARHVQLNVDVKLDNDPEILFKLMNEQIAKFDDWETVLAPRLILGEFNADLNGTLELCVETDLGSDASRSLARQIY